MAGMVAKDIASQSVLGDIKSTFWIVTRYTTAPGRPIKAVFSDNIITTPDSIFALFITAHYSFRLREEKNTQNMTLV